MRYEIRTSQASSISALAVAALALFAIPGQTCYAQEISRTDLDRMRVQEVPGLGKVVEGLLKRAPEFQTIWADAQRIPIDYHGPGAGPSEQANAWSKAKRSITKEVETAFGSHPIYRNLVVSNLGVSLSVQAGPLGLGLSFPIPVDGAIRFPESVSEDDLDRYVQGVTELRNAVAQYPSLKELWSDALGPYLDQRATDAERAVHKLNSEPRTRDLLPINNGLTDSLGSIHALAEELRQVTDEATRERKLSHLSSKYVEYAQYTGALVTIASALQPSQAKRVQILGSVVTTALYAALAAKTSGAMGGTELAASAAGLISLIAKKNQPDRDAVFHQEVMDALGKISDQIRALHGEVRANFIVMDEKLERLSRSMEWHFVQLRSDIGGIRSGMERAFASVHFQGTINERWNAAIYREMGINERARLLGLIREIETQLDLFPEVYNGVPAAAKHAAVQDVITKIMSLTAMGLPPLPAEQRLVLHELIAGRGGRRASHDLIASELGRLRPSDKPRSATPHPVAFQETAKLLLAAEKRLPWRELGYDLSPLARTLCARDEELVALGAFFRQSQSLVAARVNLLQRYEASLDCVLRIVERKGLLDSDHGEFLSLFVQRLSVDADRRVRVPVEGELGSVTLTPGTTPLIVDLTPLTRAVIPALAPKGIKEDIPPQSFYERYVRHREPMVGGDPVPLTMGRQPLAFVPLLREVLVLGAKARPTAPDTMLPLPVELGLRVEITPQITPFIENKAASTEAIDNTPSGNAAAFGLPDNTRPRKTSVQKFTVSEWIRREFALRYWWPGSDPKGNDKYGAVLDSTVCRVLVKPSESAAKIMLRQRAYWDTLVWYSIINKEKDGFVDYPQTEPKLDRSWKTEKVRTLVSTDEFYRRGVFDYWNDVVGPDAAKALRLLQQVVDRAGAQDFRRADLRLTRPAPAPAQDPLLQIGQISVSGEKPEQGRSFAIEFRRCERDGKRMVDISLTESTSTSIGGSAEKQAILLTAAPLSDTGICSEILTDTDLSITVELPWTAAESESWIRNRSYVLAKRVPAEALAVVVEAAAVPDAALRRALIEVDNARELLLGLGSEGFHHLVSERPHLVPETLPSSARILRILELHRAHAELDLNSAVRHVAHEIELGMDTLLAAVEGAKDVEPPGSWLVPELRARLEALAKP